jgi:protoheme IX farnesyltransferase
VSRSEPAVSPAVEDLVAPAASRSRMALWKSLAVLFKLRVVLLLLFAAVGGAFLAAGGWPGTANLAVLFVAGGFAAGGASAVNQYLERDLDLRMERTRQRPLARDSQMGSRWALFAGVLMIVVPVLAVLPSNPALAIIITLGAVIYVFGAWNEPGALALALLIFLWTPTHFWSLAIAYREDYARGGFPMLPVQTSPRAAACWVLLHTASATLVALALSAHPTLGWIYLAPVTLAAVSLIVLNARLILEPGRQRAMTLFHASNTFLAVLLLSICVDVLLG